MVKHYRVSAYMSHCLLKVSGQRYGQLGFSLGYSGKAQESPLLM